MKKKKSGSRVLYANFNSKIQRFCGYCLKHTNDTIIRLRNDTFIKKRFTNLSIIAEYNDVQNLRETTKISKL